MEDSTKTPDVGMTSAECDELAKKLVGLIGDDRQSVKTKEGSGLLSFAEIRKAGSVILAISEQNNISSDKSDVWRMLQSINQLDALPDSNEMLDWKMLVRHLIFDRVKLGKDVVRQREEISRLQTALDGVDSFIYASKASGLAQEPYGDRKHSLYDLFDKMRPIADMEAFRRFKDGRLSRGSSEDLVCAGVDMGKGESESVIAEFDRDHMVQMRMLGNIDKGVQKMRDDLIRLEAENAMLKETVAQLRRESAEDVETKARLRERIAGLEERKGRGGVAVRVPEDDIGFDGCSYAALKELHASDVAEIDDLRIKCAEYRQKMRVYMERERNAKKKYDKDIAEARKLHEMKTDIDRRRDELVNALAKLHFDRVPGFPWRVDCDALDVTTAVLIDTDGKRITKSPIDRDTAIFIKQCVDIVRDVRDVAIGDKDGASGEGK